MMSEVDPLRVPLAALGKGPVTRAWRLEEPEAVLGELPLPLGPIDVEVRLEGEADAGVRVRGTVRTDSRIPCRRCLDPTRLALEIDLDVWLRPESALEPGAERVFLLPEAGDLDLSDAVREEVWIETPTYVECRPDCPGLCPRCGVRLAEEECECPPPPPDERWSALLELEEAEGEAGGGG